MISKKEILETVSMIGKQHLDVRTITMGISLFDCIAATAEQTATKVYDKITTYAKDLVRTGDKIAAMYGIPIVNKRVSVTPISLIGAANNEYLSLARALDRAAMETGIDFIGLPVRVVAGAKGLAKGGFEVRRRTDKDSAVIAPEAAAEAIAQLLQTL